MTSLRIFVRILKKESVVEVERHPKICSCFQTLPKQMMRKHNPKSIVTPSTMKLSTLALAALMGAAHAQQQEAGFYKKVSQLRGAEASIPQGELTGNDDIDQKMLAMCQQQDDSSCATNDDCVWCECEAVPSSCFSKQAAHLLPDRVYTCAFSSSDAAAAKNTESISEKLEEEAEEAVEEVEKSWQATAEKATKVQSFLMEGVELNLAADEVAGDFCDASSPLSLAGYMNGEFLNIASFNLLSYDSR